MITEEQIKELVNGLIDLKEINTQDYNESQMQMRRHGIELAIMKINGHLLGEPCRDQNDKHQLQPELLTA